MSTDTLNILAEAISDVGSWWCWDAKDDVVQVELSDVQLYDESKSEQGPCSTDVLAVCFRGHAFAVFLDNLDEKGWHERFRDDDSILYPVEAYALAFDDAEKAASLLGEYRNLTPGYGFGGSRPFLPTWQTRARPRRSASPQMAQRPSSAGGLPAASGRS